MSAGASRAPDEGRSLTLFDLDDTLLPIDSDHAWGEFVTRIGWVDAVEFARRNDAFYAQYKAGELDIHEYIAFASEPLRAHTPAECEAAHRQFMAEVIGPALRPAALAVRLDQRLRLGPEGWRDDLAHEALTPGRELGGAALAQGRRREGDVGVDVEPTGPVVGVEPVVAGAKRDRVDPAELDHEFAPGMIGVDRQEGQVEVE